MKEEKAKEKRPEIKVHNLYWRATRNFSTRFLGMRVLFKLIIFRF